MYPQSTLMHSQETEVHDVYMNAAFIYRGMEVGEPMMNCTALK